MINVASLREVYVRLHDMHGDCETSSTDRDIVAHLVRSLHDDIEDSGRSRYLQRAIWLAPLSVELVNDFVTSYFNHDEFTDPRARIRAAEILGELARR